MASFSQSTHADEDWTPGSSDLVAELPDLVHTMRADGFTVRRVTFNPTDWNSGVPRSSSVDGGGLIKLGAYNYQQRGTVTVIAEDGRNWVTLRLPRAPEAI